MMKMLTEDFREFLKLLNDHQVEYMIIGGFAVAAHGYPRYTKDIDILIGTTSDNTTKMLAVIKDFGFGSLGLTSTDFQDDEIIQLGYEPNRIDILKNIPGIRFDIAFEKRLISTFDNLPVHVISRQDLIKAKEAAGRDQDLLDVRKLRAKD
jgi:predicted nucleotidyltransferase